MDAIFLTVQQCVMNTSASAAHWCESSSLCMDRLQIVALSVCCFAARAPQYHNIRTPPPPPPALLGASVYFSSPDLTLLVHSRPPVRPACYAAASPRVTLLTGVPAFRCATSLAAGPGRHSDLGQHRQRLLRFAFHPRTVRAMVLGL